MFEEITSRDVITIALSAAALGLSWVTARRASRLNTRQYELAKAQGDSDSRIAAASAEAVREQARLQRDTDIIRWASEVALILSEIAEFPMSEGAVEDKRARRHELRYRLSAQIDIGRLYFPNSQTGLDPQGEDQKPPAYRGDRQSVLDHLIAAYDAFADEAITGSEAERRLVKWRVTSEKRGFISEVHEFIDPHRYIEFRDDPAIDTLKSELAQGESVGS